MACALSLAPLSRLRPRHSYPEPVSIATSDASIVPAPSGAALRMWRDLDARGELLPLRELLAKQLEHRPRAAPPVSAETPDRDPAREHRPRAEREADEREGEAHAEHVSPSPRPRGRHPEAA